MDLCKNSGGEPETVALLPGYLFDKRTHPNDLCWRAGGHRQQFWPGENVPGQKFGQSRPVYVLTSRDTGSGGEEFSYNLKGLKSTILVGEVTWGGANCGYSRRLTDRFHAFISTSRAIDPIAKTNWEGTGVMPVAPASYQAALLYCKNAHCKRCLLPRKISKSR